MTVIVLICFQGVFSPESYTVLLSSITCHVDLIVCQLSFALHFYYFLKLLNDGEKTLPHAILAPIFLCRALYDRESVKKNDGRGLGREFSRLSQSYGSLRKT